MISFLIQLIFTSFLLLIFRALSLLRLISNFAGTIYTPENQENTPVSGIYTYNYLPVGTYKVQLNADNPVGNILLMFNVSKLPFQKKYSKKAKTNIFLRSKIYLFRSQSQKAKTLIRKNNFRQLHICQPKLVEFPMNSSMISPSTTTSRISPFT